MSGEGRKATTQSNVFHFHIHNVSTNEEQNIIQGDFVKNKTDIRKSNIGSLTIPSQDEECGNDASTAYGSTVKSRTTSDGPIMNLEAKFSQVSASEKSSKNPTTSMLEGTGMSQTLSDGPIPANHDHYTTLSDSDSKALDSEKPAREIRISHTTSDGEGRRIYSSQGTTEATGDQDIFQRQSRLRASYLKGKATSYVYNKAYEKARKLLEEILRLGNCDDIDIMLMTAECYMHLGRRGAEKRIDVLSAIVLDCTLISAIDLKSWGDCLKSNRRDVGAILLYRAASDKRSREDISPNELVTWIRGRLYDIGYPASNLAKDGSESRAIVVIYVIGILIEMLESMRAVSGVDPNHRASMEAGCHAHIVFVCNEAKEFRKSLKFGRNGIRVLESQLGDKASKNGYYSDILNKLVVTHENLGQHAEAEECYVKAMGR